MQKNDFLKSMQHVNFEPTCTCQKVVPHKLLLSLQSCACWSESVVGSPRSHKCLTGTPTLVRYRTRIFQSPIFLFAPKWSGASQSVQQITVTDSPDDSRSSSLSDSQPITFTDSPNDPSSQTASQLPSRTLRRCRATMSCDDVVRRCRAKMSCEDVVRRCCAKMSCKDVVRRCRAKMS